MDEQSWPIRVIGSKPPVWAYPLRAALRVMEAGYAQVISQRNARYDRRNSVTTIPIPIISVGNITVGGTGKTPVTIELAKRLLQLGRKPAIVARGYKSVDGAANDEERLVRNQLPDLVYVADMDRTRGCRYAHDELGADVILLDDGFQHRRVNRCIDVVLVDATCPFGYGHLLPRGLLREPVASLRRADVIVLTRIDQVAVSELAALDSELRRYAKDAPILQCSHQVVAIDDLSGSPHTENLSGKRVFLLAAIGRPDAFARTVQSLGVEIVGRRWWPDHHNFTRNDIHGLVKDRSLPDFDLFLTTEKDAVKLQVLGDALRKPVLVTKVAIDFVDDGSRMLQQILENAIQGEAHT